MPYCKDSFQSSAKVLDTNIDAMDWHEALNLISTWAVEHESRYAAFCNVHSVVTASKDECFREVLNQADLALPDGAPIAWSLRRAGFGQQKRINGPDFTWRYLAHAEATSQSVFFYGSSEETLSRLQARVQREFPRLRLGGMVSPPYRDLSQLEDQFYVDLINQSGAHVVFVGLGCPKQEFWMSDHRGRIQAVMLGVGAAFDYHAGVIPRAPLWMQRNGLEWLHRLGSEPTRLLRRYVTTNSVFVYRTFKSMLGLERPSK